MGVEIGRSFATPRSPGGTIEVRFISRFPGLRLLQPGAGRALNSRFFVASAPVRDLLVRAKDLLERAKHLR
jgi:hypothetical protein